jgi:hypothetical protein
VTGQWHDLPRTGERFCPEGHPYASDLDLFGAASLYQRISVAHTRYGQKRLAEWLAVPANAGEIQARASSVLELASNLEFRQSFEAEGMALVEKKRGEDKIITDGPDPAPLIHWVRNGEKLPLGTAGMLLSFLLPTLTVFGFTLQVVQGAHPAFWAAPLALGLGLLSLSRRATSQTFQAVSSTEGAFLRYGALLSLLEGLISDTPFTKTRLESLSPENKDQRRTPPSVVMNEFKRLVGWFDLRHNGMVYPFVNAILLWDIHCSRALLAWRSRVGERLEHWFEVIGEMEALSSLAGLLHDDPQMRLPEVLAPETEVSFCATQLGHPLLPPESRVRNDVEKFSAGEGLLITGSNMSGKSTFLRSVGINAVLAFAGGPACADSLRLPICYLGTSIRISDSLATGVSHFYAEVKRLAEVVEKTSGKLPVLFLLDEILHGTNSRERQIGARWVFAKLLEAKALGIVTTHDMELCKLPETLMRRVRQHHFREDLDSPAAAGTAPSANMTFDYTLRQGPVTSGNALRLMRRVGLGVPLEER